MNNKQKSILNEANSKIEELKNIINKKYDPKSDMYDILSFDRIPHTVIIRDKNTPYITEEEVDKENKDSICCDCSKYYNRIVGIENNQNIKIDNEIKTLLNDIKTLCDRFYRSHCGYYIKYNELANSSDREILYISFTKDKSKSLWCEFKYKLKISAIKFLFSIVTGLILSFFVSYIIYSIYYNSFFDGCFFRTVFTRNNSGREWIWHVIELFGLTYIGSNYWTTYLANRLYLWLPLPIAKGLSIWDDLVGFCKKYILIPLVILCCWVLTIAWLIFSIKVIAYFVHIKF